MKKTIDELLLIGCICFFVFKLAEIGDYLAYEHHFIPLNPLNPIFLFWFGVIFVCYSILSAIFSLTLFSNLMKNYPQTTYYLKSIGWIPYVYIICFIVYFSCQGTILHFLLENIWDKYSLSEISLVCSLAGAWLYKNPKFLIK